MTAARYRDEVSSAPIHHPPPTSPQVRTPSSAGDRIVGEAGTAGAQRGSERVCSWTCRFSDGPWTLCGSPRGRNLVAGRSNRTAGNETIARRSMRATRDPHTSTMRKEPRR